MNKPIYDGPPGGEAAFIKRTQYAFPQAIIYDEKAIVAGGMTLRAYMATRFAASFIATLPNATDRNDPEIFRSTARASIRFADALIEELAK